MIAHFIGGPWHSVDRQVEVGTPRIVGVECPPIDYSLPLSRVPAISVKEFEYEYAGVIAGIAMYAYVEPTAEVEIVIRKRVPESQVEETRAELVRTLCLPADANLYYSGPARD